MPRNCEKSGKNYLRLVSYEFRWCRNLRVSYFRPFCFTNLAENGFQVYFLLFFTYFSYSLIKVWFGFSLVESQINLFLSNFLLSQLCAPERSPKKRQFLGERALTFLSIKRMRALTFFVKKECERSIFSWKKSAIARNVFSIPVTDWVSDQFEKWRWYWCRHSNSKSQRKFWL